MRLRLKFPIFLFFILVISVFLMIVSSSFFNVLYDDTFYSNSFHAHGVYNNLANPDAKMMEIVGFFNGEIELEEINALFLDLQFSQEELSHLEDVKNVVAVLRYIYFISFGLFVLLFSGFIYNLIIKYRGTPDFKKKFSLFFMKLQISVISLCSFFLLLAWAIVFFAFDNLFLWVHRILFEEGTWRFSSDSLSMLLFPKGFFFDFMIAILRNIFMFIIMMGLLLIFVSFLYKMSYKTQDGAKVSDIELDSKKELGLNKNKKTQKYGGK